MSNVTPVQFLAALYGEPVEPGSLVIWTNSRRSGKKESLWTRNLDQAARLATRWRNSREVYFGVALQDQDAAVKIAKRRRPRTSARWVRGSAETATLVPALWADLDVAGPGHAATDLPPDRAAAFGLLEAVPRPPSIVVDTGGGYHLYWLLQRPLVLESPADRRDARDLVRRLQGALIAAAAEHDWKVDNTANLAQMLRLPGTLNHKLSRGRPVVVDRFPLASGEGRYRLRDFRGLAPAAELACRDDAVLRGRRDLDAGPPADFAAVYRGCGWLRHCYQDRTSLPEPEWYAALTVVVRCAVGGADGRRLAHRISRDHPGYDVRVTDRKVDHALDSHGPRTCAEIAGLPGVGAGFCQGCGHRTLKSSPITLGRPPLCAAPPPAPIDRPAPRPGQRSPAAPPAAPGPHLHPPPDGPAAGDGGQTAEPDDRPQILITTREGEVADQALAALARREPNLYQRGGVLVHVLGPRMPGAATPGATIRTLQQAALRELLARHCTFVRFAGRGRELRPAHPPRWAVGALLGRGAWPGLPALEGVVEAPVLRADGSVLQQPGHDPATGLLYLPPLAFDPVPAHPGDAEVAAALRRLKEVVSDFPFRCDTDRAAWLAALLTPFARPAFTGPAPLILIDANRPGTGKSLLADVCSVILTGRPAARMSYSTDEEELRKQITSVALEAAQLVLIDNVAGAFGTPTLDRALTAERWRDRLLGSNHQVSLPLKATWFATGNDVQLRGDTPRRCLRLRLESRRERPEERTDFRHPRLLSWLARERRRLVPAALTLLRAHAAAGCPGPELPGWGSYEGWSDRVRATVVWLGLPDPAARRRHANRPGRGDLEAGGGERGALHDLVRGLGELLEGLGGTATSSQILAELAADRDSRHAALRQALAESFPGLRHGRPPSAHQLSTRLGALCGRVLGDACIEREPRCRDGVRWIVRRSRNSPKTPAYGGGLRPSPTVPANPVSDGFPGSHLTPVSRRTA